MEQSEKHAPGRPGTAPHWAPSSKSGVGTAIGCDSRVWFTICDGVLTEAYFPNLDQACLRDLTLAVTGPDGFFSEEGEGTRHEITAPVESVPAYRVVNTCRQGRYRLTKEVICDPHRDAVLMQVAFEPLAGRAADYRLFVLANPHMVNRGMGNNAWTGEYKGAPLLQAEHDGHSLAIACSAPWLARSAGFVGRSDGRGELREHGRLVSTYARAENGNVALAGEVDLAAGGGRFTLSLGFGHEPLEAAHHALAALLGDFEQAREAYVRGWRDWVERLAPVAPLAGRDSGPDLYRLSAAVLRAHESKGYHGAIIASLSVPWGEVRGDDDMGGYHLVWSRDLTQAAGGLLAAGESDYALRAARYLYAIQEADGHWPQNMWHNGEAYWTGLQMDEMALPILLVDTLRRRGALDGRGTSWLWPMVRRAAGFLLRHGPVTRQDRWENASGYAASTLSVEIAALLAAADMAELAGEPDPAGVLRETADVWNACLERWTYVTGTEFDRKAGVAGHYVRISAHRDEPQPPWEDPPVMKGRTPEDPAQAEAFSVGSDALSLVRFGLRAPDDPRILDTLKVIDAFLKVETPAGPCWRRYAGDRYGEEADGSPFTGSGVGRAWPLLTGERAHYELAAGRRESAEALCRTMESFAGPGGLISEQVWDAPDIPEKNLFLGRPTGSAAPLVWAHAEYLKLRRSLAEGRVFDLPPRTVERYIERRTGSPFESWRMNNKLRKMPAGRRLRVELLEPARVRWTRSGRGGGEEGGEVETRDSGLGLFLAELPTEKLPAGAGLHFSIYWLERRAWHDGEFELEVVAEG